MLILFQLVKTMLPESLSCQRKSTTITVFLTCVLLKWLKWFISHLCFNRPSYLYFWPKNTKCGFVFFLSHFTYPVNTFSHFTMLTAVQQVTTWAGHFFGSVFRLSTKDQETRIGRKTFVLFTCGFLTLGDLSSWWRFWVLCKLSV